MLVHGPGISSQMRKVLGIFFSKVSSPNITEVVDPSDVFYGGKDVFEERKKNIYMI